MWFWYADVSVGSEGARLLPGLFRAEKRYQTQESGDCPGAEEGRVPETGEPTKESEIIKKVL